MSFRTSLVAAAVLTLTLGLATAPAQAAENIRSEIPRCP